MSFEFAEPTPAATSGGPATNTKIYEAIDFASAHKGKWFVFDTISPVPTEQAARRKARAAAASRASYVKRTASERGVHLEAATRIENDEKIVSYLRGVDEPVVDND